MGYGAGGLWMPSPGLASHAPLDWVIARNAAISAAYAARSAAKVDPAAGRAAGDLWEENQLIGTRTLTVSGKRFSLPREAQVKRSARANTAWVHYRGLTFVYSELGVLKQSDAERRAVRFELL